MAYAEEDDDIESPTASKLKRSDDDDALLRKLRGWETRARAHWSKWRQEARDCYAFVAGDQWSAEDKAVLADEIRPAVTFNRVGPMVDAVTGAEILNRQEVRYAPREIGDVQVNELIGAAADWARDQCDAADEESDCFSDVVICGLGFTETRMDYEEDPEGVICVDRVDPLEMWVDPSAKKRNCADARYVYRARWRNRDELPEEWRKKLGGGGDGDNADVSETDEMTEGDTGTGDDYEHGRDETGSDGEGSSKRVWVKHFEWWERKDGFKLSDPNSGQTVTVDKEKWRAIVQMHLKFGMQPPEAVKLKVKKFYKAVLAGGMVLEHEPIECDKFTLNCVTGKRDRNKRTWFGIVRAMRDPQCWANKWLSQILHILNTSAKGGLLYETGAFKDPRKALDEWARPDGAIELSKGALAAGAVQERKAANWPAGLHQLTALAFDSLPQVTGINLELLGLVQKEQAGVLEAQRKQAGYAILAVFFDSLRRYRKRQGRVMLYFIQHYISDGRLILIKGRDGTEQYAPLVKQKNTAKYDVIVDEAPMSANQKETVWAMLVQMMPFLTKQPVPGEVWAEFIRYSPLPSSMAQKIGQALSQPGQPDPAVQAAAQKHEAEMAVREKEIEEMRATLEGMKAEQEMDIRERELALETRRTNAELQAKGAELAMKARAEQARAKAAAEKARQDRDEQAGADAEAVS